jgi:hypothetical protein
VELAEYQLILLRAPAAAPAYTEPEENRIQREHLAFYEAQRAAGHVVTNGPMRDQPDQTLRGLAIFTVGFWTGPRSWLPPTRPCWPACWRSRR